MARMVPSQSGVPHTSTSWSWSSQSSLISHPSLGSLNPTQTCCSLTSIPLSSPQKPPNVLNPHPSQLSSSYSLGGYLMATRVGNVSQHSGKTAQVAMKRKHPPATGKEVSSHQGRKQSLPLILDRKQAVYTTKNSRMGSRTVLSDSEEEAVQHSQSPVFSSGELHHTWATAEDAFLRNGTQKASSDVSRSSVNETVIIRKQVRNSSSRDSQRLAPNGCDYEIVKTRLIERKLHNNGDYVSDQSESRIHTCEQAGIVSVQQSPSVSCNTSGEIRTHKVTPPTSSAVSGVMHTPKEYTVTLEDSESTKSTHDVLERIRKNIEKKEEFLKRPSAPIWLPTYKDTTVHRDYHVSPQKLQKPLWPPQSAQMPSSPGAISKALSFVFGHKTESQHLRRTKSELDQQRPSVGGMSLDMLPSFPTNTSSSSAVSAVFSESSAVVSGTKNPPQVVSSSELSSFPSVGAAFVAISSGLMRPVVGNTVPKPYPGFPADEPSPAGKQSKPFVSTLSRIQENIPSSIPENNYQPVTSSSSCCKATSFTPADSQSSLNSPSIRPLPLAWVGDNERVKQLHIVSTRAKKFEELKNRDEANRSAFNRFELSRLSHRSGTANVAQRREEFERKDSDRLKENKGYEFGTAFNSVPSEVKTAPPERTVKGKNYGSKAPPLGVLRSLSDGGRMFSLSREVLSRSSDSTVKGKENVLPPGVGSNRTIPIGGPKLHCDPPHHLEAKDVPRDALQTANSSSLLWSSGSFDESSRRNSKLIRQHSFSAFSRSPLNRVSSVTGEGSHVIAKPLESASDISGSSEGTAEAASVVRRSKNVSGDEGERLVRRVSYLKATSGGAFYSDSDLDSDVEDIKSTSYDIPRWNVGLQGSNDLPSPGSYLASVTSHGTLHVKIAKIHGKRAGDRSWKSVWAVVRGKALLTYKDRQQVSQTPLAPEDQVSLRGAEVGVATDYTKRRNVLRLSTPVGTELLLQAESHPAMTAWLTTLRAAAAQDDDSNLKGDNLNGDVHTPMASSPLTDAKGCSALPNSFSGLSQNSTVQPVTFVAEDSFGSIKSSRKLVSPSRTRSPTGQSPIKGRKGENSLSPKSKTWRGRLGRQLKKMQGGSSVAPSVSSLPEGASVGVCLEDCPPSSENEYVPLIVALCVDVIETRGLHAQGIYRIPGNRAAVSYLIETVNKGPKAIDVTDKRWSDVNVISSLLKQFFQKLPDPLIPAELYPLFIESSKIEDPSQRLSELKSLVQELPDHNYETLRFLMMHFSRVVCASEFNKMTINNLAIIFGPTLIRAADDNMTKMVTDMSHQCRIVESLINYTSWFFPDEEGDDLPPPTPVSAAQSPIGEQVPQLISEIEIPSSQALLLNNIQKIEGASRETKRLLMSSIISAANRKVQKVRQRRPEDEPTSPTSTAVAVTASNADGIRCHELPDPTPMSQRRVSSMSLSTVSSYIPTSSGSLTAGLDKLPGSNRDGRLFSLSEQPDFSFTKDFLSSLCSSSSVCTLPVTSGNTSLSTTFLTTAVPSATSCTLSASHCGSLSKSEPCHLGDEVAIRSYTGLSASTQERIRKFEQETKAMLQRDVTRYRKESQQLQLDRRRLEEELHRAKHDLETEDLLDQLADDPSGHRVHERDALSLPSLHYPPKSDKGLSSSTLSGHVSFANSPLVVNPNYTNPALKESLPAYPRNRRGLEDQETLYYSAEQQQEGSDLLSAITATFEKMRSRSYSAPDSSEASYSSLSQAGGNIEGNKSCTNQVLLDENIANGFCSALPNRKKNSKCRLYRDPSLHRRRTVQSKSEEASFKTEDSATGDINKGQLLLSDTERKDISWSDSQSGSGVTEETTKEKSEKRVRDFRCFEHQKSLHEKKPKELKRSHINEVCGQFRDDIKDASLKQCPSDLHSRKHNFKELLEKFEEAVDSRAPPSHSDSGHKCSYSEGCEKPTKFAAKRSGRRNRIKRRHTVGGMKDLAKFAWLRLMEVTYPNDAHSMQGDWQYLNSFENQDSCLDHQLTLLAAREKLKTSSTDADSLLSLFYPSCPREVLQRQSSFRETHVKKLCYILDSNM